jgi:hypothetical protein
LNIIGQVFVEGRSKKLICPTAFLSTSIQCMEQKGLIFYYRQIKIATKHVTIPGATIAKYEV